MRPLPERVERAPIAREDGAAGPARRCAAMPNVPNLRRRAPSRVPGIRRRRRDSGHSPRPLASQAARPVAAKPPSELQRHEEDDSAAVSGSSAAARTCSPSGAIFQITDRPRGSGRADPRDPDGAPAGERVRKDRCAASRGAEGQTAARGYDAEELDRRLVEIYRAARLGLEEGGASALYLAVGFLAWYETPTSDGSAGSRRSFCCRSSSTASRSVEGFTLRLADDEPRINVTLLELLKQDHGLVIRGSIRCPRTRPASTYRSILRTVREAIRDVDRWDVVDELRIGLFSFTKFLMWRDLVERVGDLMKNPVVDHLVNRPDQAFDAGGPISRRAIGSTSTDRPATRSVPFPLTRRSSGPSSQRRRDAASSSRGRPARASRRRSRT